MVAVQHFVAQMNAGHLTLPSKGSTVHASGPVGISQDEDYIEQVLDGSIVFPDICGYTNFTTTLAEESVCGAVSDQGA